MNLNWRDPSHLGNWVAHVTLRGERIRGIAAYRNIALTVLNNSKCRDELSNCLENIQKGGRVAPTIRTLSTVMFGDVSLKETLGALHFLETIESCFTE